MENFTTTDFAIVVAALTLSACAIVAITVWARRKLLPVRLEADHVGDAAVGEALGQRGQVVGLRRGVVEAQADAVAGVAEDGVEHQPDRVSELRRIGEAAERLAAPARDSQESFILRRCRCGKSNRVPVLRIDDAKCGACKATLFPLNSRGQSGQLDPFWQGYFKMVTDLHKQGLSHLNGAEVRGNPPRVDKAPPVKDAP